MGCTKSGANSTTKRSTFSILRKVPFYPAQEVQTDAEAAMAGSAAALQALSESDGSASVVAELSHTYTQDFYRKSEPQAVSLVACFVQ